jgi:hypothetical protein
MAGFPSTSDTYVARFGCSAQFTQHLVGAGSWKVARSERTLGAGGESQTEPGGVHGSTRSPGAPRPAARPLRHAGGLGGGEFYLSNQYKHSTIHANSAQISCLLCCD